jgi:predicted ArsR family transcriptional regulator
MEKSADAESRRVVAGYATGTAPVNELNSEMAVAWRSLLEDPVFIADAAQTLGVSAEALRALDRPPFELRAKQQGLGAVETAIIVFLGQAAIELGKDLMKDAAKKGLKQIWSRIKAKMELNLSLSAFGPEAKVEEAGDVPTGTA